MLSQRSERQFQIRLNKRVLTKIKIGNMFRQTLKLNSERDSSRPDSVNKLPDVKTKIVHEKIFEIRQAEEVEEYSPSSKRKSPRKSFGGKAIRNLLRLKENNDDIISFSSDEENNFKAMTANCSYFDSNPKKLIYDKERIERLARPRDITKTIKIKRRHFNRSNDSSRLTNFLSTLRDDRQRSTLQSVHKAYIYGVNLTLVPQLNEQFSEFKKKIKEAKMKKNLKKTMNYFKKINIVNQKLLNLQGASQDV